jgi:peptide/nickel transport system permease protein
MVFVLAGISAHPLWLGYVLSWLLGFKLGWFPISGYCDVVKPEIGSACGGPVQWAYHLALPWFVFALTFAAMYARMIRANLLEALNEDYVRTARAKGLSERATLRVHAFRNAVIPIVAMLGMDLALAFGGSLFVERAFRIPGIGFLTVTSLQRRDFPVILGVVVLVSIVIVLCNLVVDLVYAALDPRVAGATFRRRGAAERAVGVEVARPAPASLP